jgi:hypothetical protein
MLNRTLILILIVIVILIINPDRKIGRDPSRRLLFPGLHRCYCQDTYMYMYVESRGRSLVFTFVFVSLSNLESRRYPRGRLFPSVSSECVYRPMEMQQFLL